MVMPVYVMNVQMLARCAPVEDSIVLLVDREMSMQEYRDQVGIFGVTKVPDIMSSFRHECLSMNVFHLQSLV